jgi:hypothetical protein
MKIFFFKLHDATKDRLHGNFSCLHLYLIKNPHEIEKVLENFFFIFAKITLLNLKLIFL